MKIVLDNNILFSIMNPRSVSSYLFSSLKENLFAPDFILIELDKYKEECLTKSSLSEHEFDIRLNEIKESIELVNLSEYETFLPTAINNLEDVKDSPYLALALYLKAQIWSNDPHLKAQSLVKVYTTQELFDKMLNREI